jgi:hypothetical protein
MTRRHTSILRHFRVTLFEIWPKLLWSGAHCIEQAARAIAGRLIPQLPARRRFHRALLISAGPSTWGGAAVPYRPVRMAGVDAASAKFPNDYRYAKP